MKNSNVAINPDTNESLTAFCLKSKITKKQFIEESLKYFNANAINPAKHEKPSAEIEKMHKRIEDIFKFSKAQERDVIKPFFIAMVEMVNKNELKAEERSNTTKTQLINRRTEIQNLKTEIGLLSKKIETIALSTDMIQKNVSSIEKNLNKRLKIIVDNQHAGMTGKKQIFE